MNYYSTLSDQELLNLIIKEKTDSPTSHQLITRFSSLPQLLINSSIEELTLIKGIGKRKAEQLKATAEIAYRLYKTNTSTPYKITTPQSAANYVMNDLQHLTQEHLVVLCLNSKNNIIGYHTIFIGSLNSSISHPREIFATAIKHSSAFIVVCHNHPSGDTTPSNEDISITKRLQEAGKILGIALLDHIIIGNNSFYSFKEGGYL